MGGGLKQQQKNAGPENKALMSGTSAGKLFSKGSSKGLMSKRASNSAFNKEYLTKKSPSALRICGEERSSPSHARSHPSRGARAPADDPRKCSMPQAPSADEGLQSMYL
jgi:hypothetical protein